jgi:hypothetical protein
VAREYLGRGEVAMLGARLEELDAQEEQEERRRELARLLVAYLLCARPRPGRAQAAEHVAGEQPVHSGHERGPLVSQPKQERGERNPQRLRLAPQNRVAQPGQQAQGERAQHGDQAQGEGRSLRAAAFGFHAKRTPQHLTRQSTLQARSAPL